MSKKIVILGTGNVAWHLCKIFIENEEYVLQLWSRNKVLDQNFSEFKTIEVVFDFDHISKQADYYFLCVTDSAIEHVASLLPFQLSKTQVLVHCSGGLESTILQSFTQNFGCFWPIQTLTRGQEIMTKPLNIGLTRSNEYVQDQLVKLCFDFELSPKIMKDENKKYYHLAAVMVNNFTNHLLALTNDFLNSKELDFEILHHLIEETVKKSEKQDPKLKQTGPARRGDEKTIEKHLELLEGEENLKDLYQIFSKSIKEMYAKSNH